MLPSLPMMTIFLDGQPVNGLVDTGADATILTETQVLCFPHWEFNWSPDEWSRDQQDSKITTCPAHWKDLDVNQGAIYPIISTVSRNL